MYAQVDYIDFNPLLKKKNIVTYFQPIISMKERHVVGMEALSRGVVSESIISPLILFESAKKQGCMLELDRLCRKKAVERYSKAYGDNKNLILFVNIDTSILNKGVVGSGNLLRNVERYNLNPANIAIEINESKLYDMDSLKKFVSMYRKHNFLIALDDVGAGHSNLNRIALVKPDIIKLDMSLVRNIDKEFYNQEVVKSLVRLAKNIGCLVVAEGIERYEEVQCLLKYEVDMLQGYYFSKPVEADKVPFANIELKIGQVALELEADERNVLKTKRYHMHEYRLMMHKIVCELSGLSFDKFDFILEKTIKADSRIECLYVLNTDGIQVTRTICDLKKNRKIESVLFRPASSGANHSHKKYFYDLKNSHRKRYITEPYISSASGDMCITISSVFKDLDNKKYILCMEANYL